MGGSIEPHSQFFLMEDQVGGGLTLRFGSRGLGLLRVGMQVGVKGLDPGMASISMKSFGISNKEVAEGTGWLCVSQDPLVWSSLPSASFVNISFGAPLAFHSPPGKGSGLSCYWTTYSSWVV